MVDKYMLDTLAKAINNKAKELANEEKDRAIAAEDGLQVNINDVEEMFDGKSLKYVTQAEYELLSEEEKLDGDIVYFILDSEDIIVTRIMANNWDAKADQSDLDNIIDMLNGYKIWIGTSYELANVEEKDPKTLYLIIDENKNEIVEMKIEDHNLLLSKDKLQLCREMIDNVNIIFPVVDSYTEIHLYFDAEEDMQINFPECKYKNNPDIHGGNSYEIIAIFNTIHWLVEIVEYKPI